MKYVDRKDPPAQLWLITTKLRGVEELFNMASAEPPFSEEALTGISYLIGELAGELEEMRDFLEYGEREDGEEDDGDE